MFGQTDDDDDTGPPTKKRKRQTTPPPLPPPLSSSANLTPSSISTEAVSPQSRADYALYTIRRSKTYECLAVLIEAKMSKYSASAVRAQVC